MEVIRKDEDMCGVDEDMVRYKEVKEKRYEQPCGVKSNIKKKIYFSIVLFFKKK